MSITTITCPECGAKLKSAAGFAPGQAVSCSKCETDFTVREEADDADEFEPKSKQSAGGEEWSYKNSWIRYVVLGVLLVILGVLSYMLYEKRTKGDAGGGNGNEAKAGDPNLVDPAPPIVKRPNPGGVGIPAGKIPEFSLDEAKVTLFGKWERKNAGDTYSVEYHPDGSFSYTTGKDGQPTKTTRGKWTMTKAGPAANGPPGMSMIVQMEWTTEDGTSVQDSVFSDGVNTIAHPLLGEPASSGVKPPFAKKK